MQLAAAVGDEAAVGGLLDEDVVEAVLERRPASGLFEEVEQVELAQRHIHVGARIADGGEDFDVELPAEDGRRPEHRPDLAREPVDAAGQDRLDALGDRHRRAGLEPPPAGVVAGARRPLSTSERTSSSM